MANETIDLKGQAGRNSCLLVKVSSPLLLLTYNKFKPQMIQKKKTSNKNSTHLYEIRERMNGVSLIEWFK